MNKRLANKIKANNHSIIHLILVGTKPDIIKQAPLYHELCKRSELVIVCHTGQHYDFNNSKAILSELNMDVDINFRVRGTIDKKLSQIIHQTGSLIRELKKTNKIIIPYVHGDTITACGAALGSIFQKIAPVHVEAGLRTMTPKSGIYKKHISTFKKGNFDFPDYLKDLKIVENYESGSFEPFPEQIDTRMIDVVSAIRLAPNERNYDNLISERNLTSGTIVVGNTITDAVDDALKKPFYDKKLSKLDLQDFIFFTIHRRETCEDAKRFGVVLEILERLLSASNKVSLIMHPMFKYGINLCGKERFKNLEIKYKNNLIVLAPIPYHSDTIKVVNKSKLVITDSGGLQEETNILNKQCITMRYGTDRIESVIYGTNILIPLVSDDFAMEVINNILKNKPRSIKPLYGKHVSKKIVDYILEHFNDETGLFKTEEQRLKILCQ